MNPCPGECRYVNQTSYQDRQQETDDLFDFMLDISLYVTYNGFCVFHNVRVRFVETFP